MLTGCRAFSGDTASDAIAAILEREPPWDRLPDATPTAVRHLLRRCLEKDPKCRLRDIGDARIELEKALAGRVHTDPPRREPLHITHPPTPTPLPRPAPRPTP